MPGPQDVRAGGAYVEIGTEESGLVRGLAGIKKRLRRFSADISALGMQLIKVGAVLAAPLVLSIKRAGDFLEIVSKFRAVFKRQANVVLAWSKQIATAVGRSDADIIKFMATMQDTFVPLGFANDKAAQLAATVTKLALDIASFNNAADDETLMRLQSALVGNHETVRRFGIIITEAALQTELLRMGIQKNVKEASAQAKVQARLNIIIAGSADAQGDALRTADSFANSMKRLRSAVSGLTVEIGRKLIPIVAPYVKLVTEAVNKIKAWVKENGTAVQSFGRFVATLIGVGTGLLVVSRGLDAVFRIVKTGLILVPLLAIVNALGLIPKELKDIVLSAKVGGRELRTWVEPIQAALTEVWVNLKRTGFGITAFFQMVGSAIVAIFIDVALRLSGILSTALGNLIGAIPGFGKKMAAQLSVAAQANEKWLESLSDDAWKKAGDGAAEWFEQRKRELSILFAGVKKAFSGQEVADMAEDIKNKVLPSLTTLAESSAGGGAVGRRLRMIPGSMMPYRMIGVAAQGSRAQQTFINIMNNTKATAENTKNQVGKLGE